MTLFEFFGTFCGPVFVILAVLAVFEWAADRIADRRDRR